MSILAVSVWHQNPHLLALQLENYNRLFGRPVTHLINVNREYEKRFFRAADEGGVDFKRFSNLHFVARPVRTYNFGVGHAIFYSVQDALRRGLAFTHVFWHTATDLLVKPGLGDHIRDHDIGLAPAFGPEIGYRTDHRGLELLRFKERQTQPWFNDVAEDPRFAAMMRATDATRLLKMRADGCFFRREVFFEAVYPLLANMSVADMAQAPRRYPLEEFALAQCAELFCRRNPGVRRTDHAIYTSLENSNAVSPADIDKVVADPLKFGVKKFPDDPLASVRAYADRAARTVTVTGTGTGAGPV